VAPEGHSFFQKVSMLPHWILFLLQIVTAGKYS